MLVTDNDGAARARCATACMASAGSSRPQGDTCLAGGTELNPGGGFGACADAGAAVAVADVSSTADVQISGERRAVAPSASGSRGYVIEADVDASGSADAAAGVDGEDRVARSAISGGPPQVSAEAPDLWLLSSGEDGQAKIWSFPALKAAAALTASAAGLS
ncbi:hypothetical protein Vafri_3841, partial [Volvox africanus]